MKSLGRYVQFLVGGGSRGVTGVGTPPNGLKSMTSPLKIDMSTKIETVLIAVCLLHVASLSNSDLYVC